jgi:hypothetical protein
MRCVAPVCVCLSVCLSVSVCGLLVRVCCQPLLVPRCTSRTHRVSAVPRVVHRVCITAAAHISRCLRGCACCLRVSRLSPVCVLRLFASMLCRRCSPAVVCTPSRPLRRARCAHGRRPCVARCWLHPSHLPSIYDAHTVVVALVCRGGRSTYPAVVVTCRVCRSPRSMSPRLQCLCRHTPRACDPFYCPAALVCRVAQCSAAATLSRCASLYVMYEARGVPVPPSHVDGREHTAQYPDVLRV